MMDALKQTAELAVRRAVARGAGAADALIREEETFAVSVRMGEVETLKEAVSRSLRLRVFVGRRTAASQTSDLSPSAVESLVDEAVEMARLTSEDESAGLPESILHPAEAPDLRLLDSSWEELKPEDRIDWARRAEAAAFAADPSIRNSEGGAFNYERTKTVLANTAGFLDGYEGSGASISASPIAESGTAMQRDYWASVVRHKRDMESPEDVGRRAAARTVRRLGARKVPTVQAPVIFDPLTARSLIGHIFQAVSGDAVYRRSSFLVDCLDKQIASPAVTVVDDARLPAGLGSSPFDDEGVPTGVTPIIENGVLRNYLHSAYTARKLHARPTGNGSRSGPGSVVVGPTNFYLKPGAASPDDIIASVAAGLYVIELIGFGVNAVTGDYSRGAVGLWIENGKLAYPVHEVTISGNLREMLQNIEIVGNDVTFMGATSAPTLKIQNMVISGE